MVVEPHRHEGIFIARGKEDALVTRNICVGESVYGEKRIAVESQDKEKVQGVTFQMDGQRLCRPAAPKQQNSNWV